VVKICCSVVWTRAGFLETTFHAVQEILVRHRGQPLRRSWLDRPY
jgi:hypothetical protein